MKVLFITRKTITTSPGGDTIQIFSTAEYLRILGVIVEIKTSEEKIDYETYDLIHFFNIIRPDDILPHILKTKRPFVVSTIFVDYSEFEKKNRKGILGFALKMFSSDQIEYIKTIGRLLKNGDKIKSLFYLLRGHRAAIKRIAISSSMLLPNSNSEYNRFSQHYKVSVQYKAIANAIDKTIFNRNIIADGNFKNHVICVGRIEGRKNQLNLIKALYHTGINLTIIGKPSPNHLKYYEECKTLIENNSNMKLINHVNHEELSKIYQAAKVHVLPSWFETTGLTSLEAGVMNCNIVITSKGDTEEYFGNWAYYCDPADEKSIEKAVKLALQSEVTIGLKEHILNNYTWEHTAKQTLSAYEDVLGINL